MSEYTKLVTKLRTARTVSIAWEGLMSAAAAAIEELQAEVESMDESCKKQLVAMASHVADLQAEVERLKADVDAAYAH